MSELSIPSYTPCDVSAQVSGRTDSRRCKTCMDDIILGQIQCKECARADAMMRAGDWRYLDTAEAGSNG